MGTTPATDAQTRADTVPTDIQVGPEETTARLIETDQGIDHTDRDAFGIRLQHHYHQHAVNETPFLLIAMRADDTAELNFSLFNDCVGKLLTSEDDWLVDAQNHRLIVLRRESHANAAQRFFARLKVRLIDAVPEQAQAYLHAISAIVVPNGESFQNAEDFLGVALDEE